MKPNAVEVGKKIREIRTNLGYSMSQFGELVSNSPKTTVNNWERGTNLPKGDKLKKIALLGKLTTNELLYGEPEEFITRVGIEHFRTQFNPLIIQQIVAFLEQHKVDLYDEMAVLEVLQKIMTSNEVIEQESHYLSYMPIVGSDNLYLAARTKNNDIENPLYFIHIEQEKNRVHFIPYPFTEHQEALYYEWPALKTQMNIDYYARQFSLLDVELNKSTIVYYGINKQKREMNLMNFVYNNQTKVFDKESGKHDTSAYEPFKIEAEKMLIYLVSKAKNRN